MRARLAKGAVGDAGGEGVAEGRTEAGGAEFKGLCEGDWFVTRHSNLVGAHLVIHLAVEARPTSQPSPAVLRGLRQAVSAVGACGGCAIALPALLTEGAGEGAPPDVAPHARAPLHAPPCSSNATALSAGKTAGVAGGAEGGDGEAEKRATARMTRVLRCVWEVVRTQGQIRGVHVVVTGSTSPESLPSGSFKGTRDHAAAHGDTVQAVGAIVQSVCHAEAVA